MNISMILWGIPQAMRATALVYPEFAERLKEKNLVAQFKLKDKGKGRWIQLDVDLQLGGLEPNRELRAGVAQLDRAGEEMVADPGPGQVTQGQHPPARRLDRAGAGVRVSLERSQVTDAPFRSVAATSSVSSSRRRTRPPSWTAPPSSRASPTQ